MFITGTILNTFLEKQTKTNCILHSKCDVALSFHLLPCFSSFIENMPNLVRIVKKAMREWEKLTCIRFVRRNKEEDFVRFFRGSQ